MTDKSRTELEMLAQERNAPIQTVGAARAELTRRDQQHAEMLVQRQVDAATDVASATKWAMRAAIASAAGAAVQAGAAVISLLK